MNKLDSNFGCYESDCDCIDICESLSGAYNLCKKGAIIAVKRCSPAERNQMLLLNKISKQLDKLLKEQNA
jgi:hypothetical protein